MMKVCQTVYYHLESSMSGFGINVGNFAKTAGYTDSDAWYDTDATATKMADIYDLVLISDLLQKLCHCHSVQYHLWDVRQKN